MAVSPDLQGFAAAQERLRVYTGEEVAFLGDVEVTFPPDTPIDPETGRPYDPTVRPTASGQASAAVRCNVAFGARSDEAEASALGFADRTHVLLISNAANRAVCEPCASFVLRGEGYSITAQKPDAEWLGRWLIYGRQG